MDRFPAEFEDMLTAAGRRVLTGTSPLCGALAEQRRRFLAERGLVSERWARAAVQLLDGTLYDLLEPLEQPIPPETIWEMTRTYGEQLPKTARTRTAYLQHRREHAIGARRRSGSWACCDRRASPPSRPDSPGERSGGWGIQLLCYGPGDTQGRTMIIIRRSRPRAAAISTCMSA